MAREISIIIGTAFLFLVSVVMAITLLQSKMIFFPERLASDFEFELGEGEEEVWVTTADGERINALLGRSRLEETRGVVLYFHGNAGSLRTWKDVAPDFTGLGFDVLIVDYRGYGKSTGSLSEAGLYEDARGAWRYLLEQGYAQNEVVLYGRSIGAGIASDLAVEVEARALILESPFTSLVAMAKSFYPFLLPSLTLRFRFENDKKLGRVKMPILLIHGERDELIPAEHSRKLHATLEGRSELVIVEEAGHNDVGMYRAYQDALERFLTP